MLLCSSFFVSAADEIQFVSGGWLVEEDVISQSTLDVDCRAFFGDPDWTDYTYEIEARKVFGDEGFLLMFAALDEFNFYWANIGGWMNEESAIEHEVYGDRYVYTDSQPDWIETDVWYQFKIVVTPDRVEIFRDDQLLFDEPVEGFGKVGFGTWCTEAEFRNISVTANDGSWEYTPSL